VAEEVVEVVAVELVAPEQSEELEEEVLAAVGQSWEPVGEVLVGRG
jgi:hypothetical protein